MSPIQALELLARMTPMISTTLEGHQTILKCLEIIRKELEKKD